MSFTLMIVFTILAGVFTICGYIRDNKILLILGAIFIIVASIMWFRVY